MGLTVRHPWTQERGMEYQLLRPTTVNGLEHMVAAGHPNMMPTTLCGKMKRLGWVERWGKPRWSNFCGTCARSWAAPVVRSKPSA